MTIRKRLFHALESAHMQSINARLNALEAVCEAAVREAVLAERERCAQIAEADDGMAGFGGNMDFGPNVARRVATAIRKGPENDG